MSIETNLYRGQSTGSEEAVTCACTCKCYSYPQGRKLTNRKFYKITVMIHTLVHTNGINDQCTNTDMGSMYSLHLLTQQGDGKHD